MQGGWNLRSHYLLKDVGKFDSPQNAGDRNVYLDLMNVDDINESRHRLCIESTTEYHDEGRTRIVVMSGCRSIQGIHYDSPRSAKFCQEVMHLIFLANCDPVRRS